MWFALAFLSAGLLGFYDVFKKHSLLNNAVIPILFINTLVCTSLFLPFIIGSTTGLIPQESFCFLPSGDTNAHLLVVIKSAIVLSSWLCGYYAVKHLPLTIAGPIHATRPVITLCGALLIYGEQLNLFQWAGVCLAVTSFYMLSRSGKREGIHFSNNKWIFLLVAAAFLGAGSGLYDKYLINMVRLNPLFVQGWYNLYQTGMMLVILLIIWYPSRKKSAPLQWRWSILLISLFLTAADLAYFYALNQPDALISMVSMIRRGSILVSFGCGAILFHEKNLKKKVTDLTLVLLSMICIYLGSR